MNPLADSCTIPCFLALIRYCEHKKIDADGKKITAYHFIMTAFEPYNIAANEIN